jgi:hypothetical protein
MPFVCLFVCFYSFIYLFFWGFFPLYVAPIVITQKKDLTFIGDILKR